MNILHLTLSFTQGGRRRAILTLAARLRAGGVGCDLCCVGELGCPRADAEAVFGAVRALRRRSVFDNRALRGLTRLCDERGTQIIHTHDAASQAMAAVVRLWRPQVRLLMTFHRSLGFESGRLRDRLRNALAAAQCGAIVTGSRERREHFLSENYVRPEKVVRIPFGIDTNRFRPDAAARPVVRKELGLPSETLIVAAVGHYRPEKGLDRVVCGFAALARRTLPADSVLLVLGDGTARQHAALRAQCHRVPAGRVIFAGFRPDVERWLQAADVFVHAPRTEAFGLAVAEAMATGLPVVATPVGGILDLVRDGVTGALVPPDAPEQMADALERLLGCRTLREKLGGRAREIARAEYGVDLYARRYLALYEDLQAGREPKGVDGAPDGHAANGAPGRGCGGLPA
jgi:glycosyltransferase involved in cell wall biosynthesis